MTDVKIEVFTSPTCPHCPGAIKAAKELASKREGIKVVETSVATPDGQRRAQANTVRSVPTMFIKGSGSPDRIGFIGVPSQRQLEKMVKISLGEEKWDEKSESLLSRIWNRIIPGKDQENN